MPLELPTAWAMLPLGNLGDWYGGGTPRKSNSTFWDGDIPWVSPKDVKVARLMDTADHISAGAIKASATRLIGKRSILVVTRSGILANTLPVSINEVPMAINQDLKAITPFEGIDAEYLAWALRAFQGQILNQCSKHGTTVHSIELPRFRNFEIPVAPRCEQRRIVAKIEALFSKLDKGVESLIMARAQLKVYRQAVLKHAFEGKLTAQWREENKDKLETAEQLLARVRRERDALYEEQLKDWMVAIKNWEENERQGKKPPKPRKFRETENIRSDEIDGLPSIPGNWRLVRLSQIAQIGTGMSVSAARTLEDPIDVSYLRVANVQRGFLDLSTIKKMTIEKSQLDRLQLKEWDVLFNEGGDRDKLGRGWVWQSQIAPCITQNHVFRASPFQTSQFNSKIISYWSNAFGQQYFEKKGKQTTNLASINKTVLSHFPVPLIPREEQESLCKQIDKFITILDTQEHEITSAFRLAEVLRQSILKVAFSGQLVEQDPNDEPAATLLRRIEAKKTSQKPRAKTRQRQVASA